MTWYKKYLSVYEQPLQEAPQEIIREIKTKIEKLQSDTPLVSVVIIAYNEEKHLQNAVGGGKANQKHIPRRQS